MSYLMATWATAQKRYVILAPSDEDFISALGSSLDDDNVCPRQAQAEVCCSLYYVITDHCYSYEFPLQPSLAMGSLPCTW